MSVNKVILIGNLCKEVAVKYMTNGEAVANVSIACNETWKDKSGEKKESVEFVNLVFYRKLAEVAGEWLKKGRQVYVEGKMKTRSWDKDGVKHYTTEVIVDKMEMLGGNREGKHEKPARQDAPADSFPNDSLDDNIPFFEPCRHYNLWRAM